MNGVKMSDCRFYVNEEARTVICVIPNTKWMVTDFIDDHFDAMPYFSFSWAMHDRLKRKLQMPTSFVGKAVCAAEDEWNEEVGKMIAFSRAKDKCYKSFFKRANVFVQALDGALGDIISTFNNFGMKLENKKEALQAQIDTKIGVE